MEASLVDPDDLASAEPKDKLSVWGYLGFLAWAVVMAIAAPEARTLAVLGLVTLFCLLFCREALRILGRPQFWLLAGSALLLSPFFIGEKDVILGSLRLSSTGLWTGLWMTVRAVSIGLALGGFTSVVSVAGLAMLFERAGLKGLGFALGVAFNMLPTIQETMSSSITAMRLRGGFRRDRLGSLRRLFVTVVASSLRRGEEIVDSAEARAFDPLRAQSGLARPVPADLVVAMVFVGSGLAILLA